MCKGTTNPLDTLAHFSTGRHNKDKKNGHLSNLLKKTRLGSHHSEKMEFLRQIQRKKPIYAIGSFNQFSQAKATLTRPGASPFSPMGDITVYPKGVAKLLDELHVFFFSSKFQKRTPWCNDQNLVVSVLYERKKSWDPHVFEMLQVQDLLVLFVHFCDAGCYLIKRRSMQGINA